MAALILLLVALAGGAYGQTLQCAGGLGVCSFTSCSRYYTPTTTALCPSSLQRCCALEACQTRYGGSCQYRGYSCSGSTYTHDSKSQLCATSSDVCCIASAPAATTPAPREKCENYGGKCIVRQTQQCNGQLKWVGSSNEILCNRWMTNGEACCMPNNRPAPITSAPISSGGSSSSGTSSSTCGIQTASSRGKRIVGGNAANKGEWPWQVSILRASSSTSAFHSCGGTLVSSQWVVTAAHCFKGVTSRNSLRVRVGEYNFHVNEGTEANAVISQIIIHPQYIASQNANDIAMIKLSKPVDISGKYTRTACLPTVSDLDGFYRTSECYTTGWGKTQGTGGDQQVLQEVKSSLVSQSACYSKWGYKIDSTKVCFGNGYHGACQGDSGGPLVCKKNEQFHLVGVVSYGSLSCVERYVPTVFTNVAQYRTWIDQTMSSY